MEKFAPTICAAHPLGYTQPGGVTPKDKNVTGTLSPHDEFHNIAGARNLDHAGKMGGAPLLFSAGTTIPFLLETEYNALANRMIKVPVRAHTTETAKHLQHGMWVYCGKKPLTSDPLMFDTMEGDNMVLIKPNGCDLVLTKATWTTSAFQCLDGFASMQVKHDQENASGYKMIHVGGPVTVGMIRKKGQGGLCITATIGMIGVDQHDVEAVAEMSPTLDTDISRLTYRDTVHTMLLVPLPGTHDQKESNSGWRLRSIESTSVLMSNKPRHLHLTYADTAVVTLHEALLAMACGDALHALCVPLAFGIAAHSTRYKLELETRVQGDVDSSGIQHYVPESPSQHPNAIDVVLLGKKSRIANTCEMVIQVIVHELHYVFQDAREAFSTHHEPAYLWRGCVLVNNMQIHFGSSHTEQTNIIDALKSLNVVNCEVIQEALRAHLNEKRSCVMRLMNTIRDRAGNTKAGYNAMFAKFATQGICIFHDNANEVPDWAKEPRFRKGRMVDPTRGDGMASVGPTPPQVQLEHAGALPVATCAELCDALKDKLAEDALEQTTAFAPEGIARRLCHTLMQLEDRDALQRMTGQAAEEAPELHPAPVMGIIVDHMRKKRKTQDMVEMLQVANDETPASEAGDRAEM